MGSFADLFLPESLSKSKQSPLLTAMLNSQLHRTPHPFPLKRSAAENGDTMIWYNSFPVIFRIFPGFRFIYCLVMLQSTTLPSHCAGRIQQVDPRLYYLQMYHPTRFELGFSLLSYFIPFSLHAKLFKPAIVWLYVDHLTKEPKFLLLDKQVLPNASGDFRLSNNHRDSFHIIRHLYSAKQKIVFKVPFGHCCPWLVKNPAPKSYPQLEFVGISASTLLKRAWLKSDYELSFQWDTWFFTTPFGLCTTSALLLTSLAS